MSSRIRVLVVEDDVLLGKALVRVLSDDFDVVHAPSGRVALAALGGGDGFDVILCDVVMPEMDGVELYEQLDEASRPRVVFMTGGVHTSRLHKRLTAVAPTWLQKPVDKGDLRRAIETRVSAIGSVRSPRGERGHRRQEHEDDPARSDVRREHERVT